MTTPESQDSVKTIQAFIEQKQALENILRPLAERRVCPDHPTEKPHLGHGLDSMPDPRFDALRRRCDREWRADFGAFVHPGHLEVNCPGYIIKTDLGSLVRAAAAWGWNVEITFNPVTELYEVALLNAAYCESPTPEEALSRALVAAVGAEG